ncbi:Alpha/Beta hydrolase protein [Apodospora peruviana]|uniref:Alpha/Beta hydrolase protein n=1 Tax=Apodospora peruviana TaxID=516989 RepID=A0AAE0HV53_9PEZI|nr:Alpha/Beta hydrolase protein [Apodospora peruviana]
MAPPPVLPPVASVLQHPAYPTAVWNLVPDRKGLAPVAEGRGGPFNISWEIHGEGPIKMILIMGLAGFKTAWQRQTLYFGHQNRQQYQVLVCDNRGMGDSDRPLMRYSSSEMARDLIDVMAHVGWLPSSDQPAAVAEETLRPPKIVRTIHVVGISLGGMIAQEMACLIAEHISSLTLCCTAAAIENTTTYAENMANRISMLVPKSVDRSVGDTARQIFNHEWLMQPDDVDLPDPATIPKCLAPSSSDTYLKFNTNAERFIAQEMHKRRDKERFTLKGFLLQLIAAGWHHKTPQQLADMADRIGRHRICVMHGTEDKMITVPHGRKLIEYLQPGLGIIEEGMGHAPLAERWEWFNRLLAGRIYEGERLDLRGPNFYKQRMADDERARELSTEDD